MANGGFLVGSIEFLDKLGIYDVALPFFLVFVIVFAILEKTKVFGTEEFEGNEIPRRNLNAMAAFVIGFLVIASTNLVKAISTAAANIVLLLVLSVSFLMLVGSFTDPEKMKKGIFLEDDKWRYFFMIIMFIAVVLIFLDAIPADSEYCGDKCTWLTVAYGFVEANWSNSAFGAVLLLIMIAGFIWWVQRDGKKEGE